MTCVVSVLIILFLLFYIQLFFSASMSINVQYSVYWRSFSGVKNYQRDLKFIKIREFYDIFKIRKKNSCWHISSKLITTSFRIYSEATVEWEEWAVDSCGDTEWHSKRSVILVNWLTIWQQLTKKIFVRFDFWTYLQFVRTLYFVRMFIRHWLAGNTMRPLYSQASVDRECPTCLQRHLSNIV